MKKMCLVLAALATIAVAVPTVASAQGFSVRVGSDRTLIIAIVTTIAALVPSSTLMTADCIAVGTTMTATER